MKTLKTLTIVAALVAGVSSLAMAQGASSGSTAIPGAAQEPGARTGSGANDQKDYKAPNNQTQDYSNQQGGRSQPGK